MSATARVLLLNGPNLNLLGLREPHLYGSQTLAQLVAHLNQLAHGLGLHLSHCQSNAEHQLIDAIHAARTTADFIIINPAAFTHTSVALRDALAGVALPVVEVHISNVHKREEFRHHSYISGIADGVIAGLGIQGYEMALHYLVRKLAKAG